MSDFNLIDEPWIPCAALRDGRVTEYGIQEVLVRAPEIREIVDPSPLVTIALHRMLLALLHRVFGPRDTSEWAALWAVEGWDAARLAEYFETWRSRFGLFDECFPFYQARSVDFEHSAPASKLTHEFASGNNATLFDHTSEGGGFALTPQAAARYLVAHQAFAVGGLVSFDKKEHRSADAAPLAKGAVSLVRGPGLFRTLMLNLAAYWPEHSLPIASASDDCPTWERREETRACDRRPRGYLDLLTWQSRRIRLQRDPDGLVRRVVIMKGYQFPDGYWRRDGETMMGFRSRERAKPGEDPWPPVGFQEDRALWRDSLALLQSVETQRDRPRIFDWLNDLVADGTLDGALIVPADFFGMRTDPKKAASVLFWRHERLEFPLSCLRDEHRLGQLRLALQLAERVGRELRLRAERLAKALLAPASDRKGARQPLKADVSKLASSLAAERRYWPRLEAPFRAFLVGLGREDAGGAGAGPDAHASLLKQWLLALRRSALSALAETTGGIETSGRSVKAVALAETGFRGRLTAILEGHNGTVEEDADAPTVGA